MCLTLSPPLPVLLRRKEKSGAEEEEEEEGVLGEAPSSSFSSFSPSPVHHSLPFLMHARTKVGEGKQVKHNRTCGGIQQTFQHKK